MLLAVNTPVPPVPFSVTFPRPLMVLATVDVPDVLVNDKVEVASVSASVLPAAPKEPPVPMAKVLPALTVVAPANALLLPVKVTTPVPA